jgi:preprotein translocase subunit Sss1
METGHRPDQDEFSAKVALACIIGILILAIIGFIIQ